MNHFVDFGKRSIELPSGCKDLFDVLQLEKRPEARSFTSRVGQSLGDVGSNLNNLLARSTRSKNLVITWGSGSYIHLQNKEQVVAAIVVVHEGVLREQSVRAVFAAADLALVSDETVAAGTIRVLRYSLPVSMSVIGRLIPNLLLRGFGLALRKVKYELLHWEESDS